MKTTTRLIVILSVLFTNCKLFGQFNTLARALAESKESFSQSVEKKLNQQPIKGHKKIWKFKGITKSDLRKEIDSLRKIILKINDNKNQVFKLRLKKIEDSLISVIDDKIQNLKAVSKKTDSTYIPQIVEKDAERSYLSKLSMPLQNRLIITSSFGNRFHPIFKISKLHNGIDLKANYERVFAVMDGYVTESGWDRGGGGNYIKIRHSDSYVTSYLHLSEIYYKAGEFVKAGFIIGKSGNTGNSTGPHLHFSVSEKGKYVNPIAFLNNLIKANNLFAKYYEH